MEPSKWDLSSSNNDKSKRNTELARDAMKKRPAKAATVATQAQTKRSKEKNAQVIDNGTNSQKQEETTAWTWRTATNDDRYSQPAGDKLTEWGGEDEFEGGDEEHVGKKPKTLPAKDKQKKFERVMKESKHWIRDMEAIRDEMHRASIRNAILLDFLAMQGLDDDEQQSSLELATEAAAHHGGVYHTETKTSD